MADFYWQQDYTKTTLDRLDAIASVQEARVNEAMNRNIERLDGVSSDTQLRFSLSNYLQDGNPDDLSKINKILTDAVNSIGDFNVITLFSMDGDVITSINYIDYENNHKPMFFPEGKSERYITVIFDEHYDLFLSSPLILDDEKMGVIVIESEPDTITSITQDYSGLGYSGETVLAKRDANGDSFFITPLRFNSDATFSKIVTKDQIQVPITQALLFNEEKFIDATDYRGEKVFAVSKYIENSDFGLVVKIDSSEVFAAHTQLTFVLIGTVIILMGIISSVSLLLSDKILNPLLQLKKVITRLEHGKYDSVIKANGNNEVTSLIHGFQNLQKALAENKKNTENYERDLEQKLRESNYLRNALDESSLVTITDKEGTIIYANDQFCKVSKYSREEIIGQDHRIINSGYYPPQFFDRLWKTISSGKVWKADVKNRAKDGSFYWVKTTIVPLIGRDGKPEQYIAIRTDITKQKAIEEKLKVSLEEVKKADTMKDEFSTMVSHELKTPLTPIKFNAEMLKVPDLLGTLNQDQLDAVEEIDSNTTRLENLISDILYGQKLDMKKLAFNKKKFNIADLIERIRKNLLPIFKEKQVNLEILNYYTGDIFSDDDRIHQVLENLINNAVDFVPEKSGKITLGVQKNSDFVTFSVKDNGIGISKDNQQHLFKKFYQVDTSHTRKHGGTGLGLVICKGFVEGLGGEIWCESEKGKGSTFFFTIPKKQEIEVNH